MKTKKILTLLVTTIFLTSLAGCDLESATRKATRKDMDAQINASNSLAQNQSTPVDIEYSLERYNLIRRTYWVNGQREKANSLPCEIEKPLGYIVLLTESGAIVGSFVVDGKISSLNSFLTPDSEYYSSSYSNRWLADVDGSYGENDDGIFFFTPDGKYIEWNGTYLYSDIPFSVDEPVVKIGQ